MFHVLIVYYLRVGKCLHCEDLLLGPDEDIVYGALHLRQHPFAPVISFLLGSCKK